MLLNIFYPPASQSTSSPEQKYPFEANCGSAGEKAIIAFGIFLNNRTMYEYGISLISNSSCANLSGSINPEGQSSESGRDQAHTQLGLGNYGEAFQMAWNQGDDLFSLLDNRLLVGYEYTAQYNLGYSVHYNASFYRCDAFLVNGPWPIISNTTRGQWRPVWELPYAHYVSIKNLSMPNTLQQIKYNSPDGPNSPITISIADNAAWETLRFRLDPSFSTDVPKIRGLPEAPGWPIFGSLIHLGDNHALSLSKLSKTLGPVFQVRMGNKRIIVANSFDSIKELWIRNQASLISRPLLHTFHTVVSSSQGFTIGTSPWDESCKRRRKAVATALNKPAVQSYMPLIDIESYSAMNEIFKECQDGQADINISPHLHRFALNTSLMLNYGTRFSSSYDQLLREIVEVEGAISKMRSTSDNWQDYIPLLRLFPAKSNEANSYRLRRDHYLNVLLDGLKKDITNGTDRPCITGNILKDPSAKLNEAEIKSVCLSMVNAALETVPKNIIFGIGYLSSPHGQEIQERAYQEIQDTYPLGDTWEKCLVEEEVPYVTALCKEILRYFTVIRICLPRRSIADIEYKGATIPGGTIFYMNAFAGDYDENHFQDPYTFNPERYLGDVDGTPHFAYGAGSRMCAGAHLANRELFTFFIRLITAFRILPPNHQEMAAKTDAMEANACHRSLIAEPKPFKCRFIPRNKEVLESWLESSRKRTKDV